MQDRARMIATKIIRNVDHTMLLEAQNLDKGALVDEIDTLAAQILRENHKIIWDDKK